MLFCLIPFCPVQSWGRQIGNKRPIRKRDQMAVGLKWNRLMQYPLRSCPIKVWSWQPCSEFRHWLSNSDTKAFEHLGSPNQDVRHIVALEQIKEIKTSCVTQIWKIKMTEPAGCNLCSSHSSTCLWALTAQRVATSETPLDTLWIVDSLIFSDMASFQMPWRGAAWFCRVEVCASDQFGKKRKNHSMWSGCARIQGL